MVTNGSEKLAVVLQALVMLAEAPRGMLTSTGLGDLLDLNPVVVRRLLGILRAEGIVESRSGPRGGWAIARDPATLTLGRVHRALADERDVVTPMALDQALLAADEAYAARLDEVTLGAVMGPSV